MPYHSFQIFVHLHHCCFLLPCSLHPSGKLYSTAALQGQPPIDIAFQIRRRMQPPPHREQFAKQVLHTNPATHAVLPNPYSLHQWCTRTHVPRLFHQVRALVLHPVAISVVHSSIFPTLLFLPNTHLHYLRRSHTQNSSRT